MIQIHFNELIYIIDNQEDIREEDFEEFGEVWNIENYQLYYKIDKL